MSELSRKYFIFLTEFFCYPEAYHPGVLRLTGGPNQNCESVRNFLAAGSLIGFLDPTAGKFTYKKNPLLTCKENL